MHTTVSHLLFHARAMLLACTLLGAAGCTPHMAGQTDAAQIDFTWQGAASSVCLVGSFNRWNSTTHCLTQKTENTWTLTIMLEPGRYEFGFVVNNGQLTPGPTCPLVVEDDFGGKSCVLFVE